MALKQNLSKTTSSGSAPDSKPHYIVAVGASAGGLEAIHELFDNLPQDTACSFILIQHLSPDYKSLMAELLTKHTKMKVWEAEDGMLVRANCVYVIPSRKIMTIRHGKLRLTEKEVSIPNNAIDTFLYSLALDKGQLAVAIILSGTGTDGTRGIESIKKAGGLVIVQDPTTARFDGMPNSAIASGNTDFVLAPEMMPDELVNHTNSGQYALTVNGLDEELNENTLKEIFGLIQSTTTYDFTAYKRPTIMRRIARRMTNKNITHPNVYLSYLRNNPEEINQLSKEFLIGVTKFFRDTEAFNIISEKIIPDIVNAKAGDEEIKIWVAACSTGEEAYSMAIMLCEYLSSKEKSFPIKIFATDIDKEAVSFAARGLYPESIAKDISPDRLDSFFIKKGNSYAISEHIRKMVIFAHHNVLKDPPFSRVDLVSCRNMLIYMDAALQKKILSVFHFSLNPKGYLFLGTSENLGELKNFFSDVDKKWKIYQNLYTNRAALPEALLESSALRNIPTIRTISSKTSKSLLQSKMGDIFNDCVVEEYGYAGVFVDEHYELIQGMGDYKRYIQLPDKKLQFNLLKMVPEDLSVPLGAAIRKAIKLEEKVVLKKVKVRSDKTSRLVNIVIKPYLSPNSYMHKFIFVLFHEEKMDKRNVQTTVLAPYDANLQAQFNEIELELRETKENLNLVVEELETSNEELQSSNEELLSSNEELQSTNEELQSLNEELHTVNAEHQLKIKELVELSDDFNNYFRSSDIGQVFIDCNLLIRKYTPAATSQINLIENDIGRPISHISTNIRYDNLSQDIQKVIDTSATIQKEIELNNGRYYLMRIMPYIRLDKQTDGAVITFVDITDLKNLNNIISTVLNSSLSGIIAFKSVRDNDKKIVDFEGVLINLTAEKMLGRKASQLVGKRFLVEMPDYLKDDFFEKYRKVVETGKPFHIEHQVTRRGDQLWFEIIAVKMEDGFIVTMADITDKKNAEEKVVIAYEELKKVEEHLLRLNNELEQRVQDRTAELSASEERFRLVSLATNDAIWDWNIVNNQLWWNEGFKTLFGYASDQIEPGIESWYDRMHPDDRERIFGGIDEVINGGATQWAGNYRFLKADGSYAFVSNRGYVLHDENGTPYRMLGSLMDLTSLQ